MQAADLSRCWSETMSNNQLAKRPWLLVKNSKLGCKFCSAVGSFHFLKNMVKGRLLALSELIPIQVLLVRLVTVGAAGFLTYKHV